MNYRLAEIAERVASLGITEEAITNLNITYNSYCYEASESLDPEINGDTEDWLRISITLDFSNLRPTERRHIKRVIKLEVPSWAKDSPSPPLEGRMLYPGKIIVEANLTGAYECRALGVVTVPPSSYAVTAAQNLRDMTIEEKLAYIETKAAELEVSREKQTYSCHPKS